MREREPDRGSPDDRKQLSTYRAGDQSVAEVAVRAALLGKERANPPSLASKRTVTDAAWLSKKFRPWWPEATLEELEDAIVDGRGEVEIKAARRLAPDMDPRVVAVVANRLWGHGMTKERDDRVRRMSRSEGLSDRAIQARRGHISRQLTRELDEAIMRTIGEGTSQKAATAAVPSGTTMSEEG